LFGGDFGLTEVALRKAVYQQPTKAKWGLQKGYPCKYSQSQKGQLTELLYPLKIKEKSGNPTTSAGKPTK